MVVVLVLFARGSPPAVEPGLTVAAFDIGSGSTRLLVAELDACGGTMLNVLDRKSVPVPYAADLLESKNGEFSGAIRATADQQMAKLTSRASEHGAEVFVGVATQAFRSAGNSASLLDGWRRQLGLDVRVLSQDEEARLGYLLVAAKSEAEAEPLLVWDIGAGSQQLVWQEPSTGRWAHVNSDLASVTFRNRALAVLHRPAEQSSPNPIVEEEVARLQREVLEWLGSAAVDRVAAVVGAGYQVVGIGGVHGASLVNQLGLADGEPITRSALAQALAAQLGRTDEEIGGAYADTEVVNLILVSALMDLFGIEQYSVMGLDLTEALLLSLDESCQPDA